MKRTALLFLFVFLGWNLFSQNSSEKSVQQHLAPAITPEPAFSEISPTEYYPLTSVLIECPDNSAGKWAEKHLKQWYGKFAPEVGMTVASGTDLGDEAYDLIIDKNGVTVRAQTLQGVRYAMYSLRQIAMPQRKSVKVEGWIVPKAIVNDKPALSFRGIHICWFHEREPWQIERMIRLAAYYKMNYAVIEPWGTYRSKVAPWYGWSDGTMTEKEVSRLKKIADDLGITLIPQINIFGHASLCRISTGKHAALDLHPEYQPLFEPDGGWNWCLSNPETRKLLVALIEERMEAFGNPPFFHIGADEAHRPSCPDCISKPYLDLMLEHINVMCETVRKKGARPMMWHDMLLERNDPRWKGFKANGMAGIEETLLKFPKDMVICDWYYREGKETYPTLDYFKGLGFQTLACPWVETSGIKSVAKYARQGHADGILGTVWHRDFGKQFVQVYLNLSNAAWNAGTPWKRNQVMTHLRQVMWDMNNKDSKRAGTFIYELPATPTL